MKSKIDDKTTYNQQVMAWLKTNCPDHAEELNQHGTARGWWFQVNYLRIKGKTVPECGQSISEIRLYNAMK